MYKGNLKISLFVILFVMVSGFVFAQQEVTLPIQSQQVVTVPTQTQQVADVVHQVMTEQKKDIIEDINKHMDENFGQLDARILDNNRILFRKGIFAILGGMTVVLIGYAYLVNRVTKKYDINFYEKMIESRIKSLNVRLPGSLYLGSMYKPITYLDGAIRDRFESPSNYFHDIAKKQESSVENYEIIKEKIKSDILYELSKANLKHSQKKLIKQLKKKVKPLSKGVGTGFKFDKKGLLYMLAIIVMIAILVIYFYFKYFRKATTVPLVGGA